MVLSKKIKAGALQYVLVISVIIAIIIFAFISLVFLQQKLTIKQTFSKQAISNTQSAFEYLKYQKIEYGKEVIIPFLEEENATTTLLKKRWGLFDIGIATSKVKNEFFEKVALLGFHKKQRPGLILKDNNNALVLVGKTKITGEAFLPKQGVKTGNIAGISYYGNQLIYGKTKQSEAKLPSIHNMNHLKNIGNDILNKTFQSFELEDELVLHQSFTEDPLVFKTNGTVFLSNISLSGHIVIISENAITIDASAKLQDVLIIAPNVKITSGVKGNFQVVATNTIEVEDDVQLNYPSVLFVNKPKTTINPNQNVPKKEKEIPIHVKKNSIIKGIVGYSDEQETGNYDSQIKISASSIVHGEMYCTQNLELLGNVYGTVITNNFLVRKSGGVYVNHIYDSEININKLPEQYVGIQFDSPSNQVAKWVD